ncbi:AEC family transporter [Candidatus Albibeggiatoa sp. nov. NOAA]|uniref:AEC family transporter n=1 Tax=Candidatus Albibeggiatoa sp. nov. NOAA TaxID=3162724 RepID=UPI0032FEC46A|nr:AEC family transporter [Thiotrichaceae bacterium]
MLILRIISILFPIFFIVFVAYLYTRSRPVDMRIPNQLNMDVFIPALLLTILADKSFDLMHYQQLALVWVGIVLFSGIILLPLVGWWKVDAKTFIPPMMFGNTGNMGIPIILFAFGSEALPIAALLFILSTTINFIVTNSIMGQHTKWWHIFRLPMVIATLLGLTLSLLNIQLPEWLLVPLDMLGQIAVPLMLFTLGVRLIDIDFNYWRIGLLGGIVSPVLGVLLYLLVQPYLTIPDLQQHVLLIYCALPPAVVNYIFAEQYHQEPHKVASIVLIGNILSLISLPIALAWTL